MALLKNEFQMMHHHDDDLLPLIFSTMMMLNFDVSYFNITSLFTLALFM